MCEVCIVSRRDLHDPEHQFLELKEPRKSSGGAHPPSDEQNLAVAAHTRGWMEMGFSEEQVTAALVAANMKVDLGLDYLLNGIPEHKVAQMSGIAA